jgi:hypothetical protein
MPRLTNLQKVEELFQPCINGFSQWVSRQDIEASELPFSNNGNSRNGVFFGVTKYIWEVERGAMRRVEKLRLNGLNPDTENRQNRPIRDDIHAALRDAPGACCVACGSSSSLVTDHKNDLYNDIRVLQAQTQTIDDFQVLCTHCNLQKRQVSKRTRETGLRYGATNIPSFAVFGIDFTEGDETYDPSDINAMRGTYWYDPIEFMNKIKEMLGAANTLLTLGSTTQ